MVRTKYTEDEIDVLVNVKSKILLLIIATFLGNKNKPNGRLNNSNGREIRRGNHENLSMYKHDANQAIYPINEINTGNLSSSRSNGLKKPPFTYTELIEHALQERGELTVSAIYQWIS